MLDMDTILKVQSQYLCSIKLIDLKNELSSLMLKNEWHFSTKKLMGKVWLCLFKKKNVMGLKQCVTFQVGKNSIRQRNHVSYRFGMTSLMRFTWRSASSFCARNWWIARNLQTSEQMQLPVPTQQTKLNLWPGLSPNCLHYVSALCMASRASYWRTYGRRTFVCVCAKPAWGVRSRCTGKVWNSAFSRYIPTTINFRLQPKLADKIYRFWRHVNKSWRALWPEIDKGWYPCSWWANSTIDGSLSCFRSLGLVAAKHLGERDYGELWGTIEHYRELLKKGSVSHDSLWCTRSSL